MAADQTSRGVRKRRAFGATLGATLALVAGTSVARADDPPTSVSAPVAVAELPGVVEGAMIRVPRPTVVLGPRRVGIQAGHWRMADVPPEQQRMAGQTGTSAGGVTEWQVNVDIAHRVATILRADGIEVDILPATVPEGYLADAFLALHADGDLSGGFRGYKVAHGTRRGPYEDRFVTAIVEEYGRTTGLPWNREVSRNMTGYYAFGWSRFRASVAPHTPAAILEMGFLTNAEDRAFLVLQPDRVAGGIARGLRRFLDEVPAGLAFAEDLVLPPASSWWTRLRP